MSKKSKKQAQAAAPQVPQPPVINREQQQADTILQLSAQTNATKQLVDELITANIGLRSQSMLIQHQLNGATQVNQNLETENASLKVEVEELKKQVAKFEKECSESEEQADLIEDNDDQDDQEAAA